MKRIEGFIDASGGKVWYEIVGDANTIPLITLHGGPGYPHDSLEPLEDLADERKVIFYDQLGCGNSQKTSDKSLWSVEYFVKELGEVIENLKFKKYHLLGHSWGAGLAVAFTATKPQGLKSLILSDPYLSTPIWEKDAERLLRQLPENMRKALKEGPLSEGYKEALKEFNYRFLDRQKKLSVATLKSEFKMNLELYNYMWGPEEFNPTGTLKSFDLSKRLPEIKIPVLLLCGRCIAAGTGNVTSG